MKCKNLSNLMCIVRSFDTKQTKLGILIGYILLEEKLDTR